MHHISYHHKLRWLHPHLHTLSQGKVLEKSHRRTQMCLAKGLEGIPPQRSSASLVGCVLRRGLKVFLPRDPLLPWWDVSCELEVEKQDN